MNWKNILAVIPARGGSKGIPWKNIKNLCGKPLIAYTIEPALQSGVFTDVVVTSDSDEILSTAQELEADTIKRPDELSHDTASSIDTVIHAVTVMEERKGHQYDIIFMLQPTTPLRRTEDIIESMNIMVGDESIDSVISVVKSPGINPEWMKTFENGRLIDIDSNLKENAPRQDRDIYIRSGAIYAVRRKTLVEDRSLKGGNCRPYIMPTDLWVNIDSMNDWLLAEAKINLAKKTSYET